MTKSMVEKMIFTLNTIAGFPKAAEETGQCSDFVAGLELAASYARVMLERVAAEKEPEPMLDETGMSP